MRFVGRLDSVNFFFEGPPKMLKTRKMATEEANRLVTLLTV